MADETGGVPERETLASLQVPNTTWRALPAEVRTEVIQRVPTQVRAIRRALGGTRRVRRIDDATQQRIERLAGQVVGQATGSGDIPHPAPTPNSELESE